MKHVSGNSLSYEMQNSADSHYAYLIRIMTLIKQSKIDLKLLSHQPEALEEYLIKAQEKLESETSIHGPPRSRKSVITDLKESLQILIQYIRNKIEILSKTEQKLKENDDNDDAKEDEFNNPNCIKYFNLNRCILPSGKILWLCPEHRKDDNIQTLTTDYGSTQITIQNDEFNTLMLEYIKTKTKSIKQK